MGGEGKGRIQAIPDGSEMISNSVLLSCNKESKGTHK